jgi:preprotein translocase SecE subunit
VANSSSDKAPKKRLVKNPETFRERALKANESNDRPKRSAKLKLAGSRVTSPVLKPVGRGLSSVGRRKPVRLIGHILLPGYIRGSISELRMVKWPSKRESRDLTFAVLAFAVVFGGVVALVDYGLDKVFRGILLK